MSYPQLPVCLPRASAPRRQCSSGQVRRPTDPSVWRSTRINSSGVAVCCVVCCCRIASGTFRHDTSTRYRRPRRVAACYTMYVCTLDVVCCTLPHCCTQVRVPSRVAASDESGDTASRSSAPLLRSSRNRESVLRARTSCLRHNIRCRRPH